MEVDEIEETRFIYITESVIYVTIIQYKLLYITKVNPILDK